MCAFAILHVINCAGVVASINGAYPEERKFPFDQVGRSAGEAMPFPAYELAISVWCSEV